MIKCDDFMGKNYFESYSEFYLMLAVAKECYRRGTQLDMSSMYIEKSILPENILDYYKILVNTGAIYCHGVNLEGIDISSDLDLDTSCLGELELENKVFIEYEDHFEWTYEMANDYYSNYRFTLLNSRKMGNTLIHLVAYHMASIYMGYITDKPLRIVINDRQKVESTYLYINLISCSKTLNRFREMVQLDIDFSSFTIDLDYSIFYNNGRVAGRHKLWSVNEKRDLIQKIGISEGSIALLWERKGMNDSNPAGKIVGSTLVRVDKIEKDYVYLTCLYLAKTKEELIDDYYEIPPEKRELFSDLLSFKVKTMSQSYSYISLGVSNYMSMEESLFLDKIDRSAYVTKKITVDGETSCVEMSEVDALYWLLCQFEVEFDRILYKNMYNDGKDLLWDLYGV